MKLRFLGTSAGTPTRQRNVTAQAVRFDHGALWLLDCGEGTQHRAMAAGLPGSKVERILITHLHGDHCLGLPGFLSWIGIHGRTESVEVVGPRGIDELLHTVLRLTSAELPFPLCITELDEAVDLPALRGWRVLARPIVHRVPCFGYVLVEEDRPGKFHEDRARRLGLPHDAQRMALLRGEPVRLADGTIILPSDVCDPPRRGRRLVLLGDTSDPEGIAAAAKDCDLLVCEATYADDRAAKADQWGHMTAGATGAFAHRIGARRLALTHFSARYTDSRLDQGLDLLLAQARAQAPGVDVVAADDHLEVDIS
jgi:ribonuclease Z